MSARDDIQSAVQMMTMEMRNLSNSFNHAVRNMQQATSGAMAHTGVMAGTAQGYAASAMGTFFPPGAPPRPGFAGMPTSYQHSGGMASYIDSGKDAAWRNWLTSAGNNEYNQPSSWWRDTMALMGRQFVDVSQEDAKRRASRNWALRGGNLLHSGVSIGLAHIPLAGIPLSIGYEALVKPALMEGTRRSNEYWDMLEQTGYRNIGARWSDAPGGGWTDDEQRELASKLQGLYKGSGFKKTQFDELITSAEQHGYFKSYDRTNVDREVEKTRKLIDDAKYVMQALHTSADEAAKVLADVNKMGATSAGVRGSHSYISQLNTASAYSGLSPMQIHEYSVGRSDFFRNLGYSKRDATEITMQQITRYHKDVTAGKPEDLGQYLNISDRLSAMARDDHFVNQMFGSMMIMGDGKLEVDRDFMMKVLTGDASMKDISRRQAALLGSVPEGWETGISQNARDHFIAISGLSPALIEDASARMQLHSLMYRLNIADSPLDFTLQQYHDLDDQKKRDLMIGVSRTTGVPMHDVDDYISGMIVSREDTRQRMIDYERIAQGYAIGPGEARIKKYGFWRTSGQGWKAMYRGATGWNSIRQEASREVLSAKYAEALGMVPDSLADEESAQAQEDLRLFRGSRRKMKRKDIDETFRYLSTIGETQRAANLLRYAEWEGIASADSFSADYLVADDKTVGKIVHGILGDRGIRLDFDGDVDRERSFQREAMKYAKDIAGKDWREAEDIRNKFIGDVLPHYIHDYNSAQYSGIARAIEGSLVENEWGYSISAGTQHRALDPLYRNIMRNESLQDKGDDKAPSISMPAGDSQIDINTTVLSYMQQQVTAMNHIVEVVKGIEK